MPPSETMNRAHIVLWALWDRTANHRHSSFPREPTGLMAAICIAVFIWCPLYNPTMKLGLVPSSHFTVDTEKLVYN